MIEAYTDYGVTLPHYLTVRSTCEEKFAYIFCAELYILWLIATDGTFLETMEKGGNDDLNTTATILTENLKIIYTNGNFPYIHKLPLKCRNHILPNLRFFPIFYIFSIKPYRMYTISPHCDVAIGNFTDWKENHGNVHCLFDTIS